MYKKGDRVEVDLSRFNRLRQRKSRISGTVMSTYDGPTTAMYAVHLDEPFTYAGPNNQLKRSDWAYATAKHLTKLRA